MRGKASKKSNPGIIATIMRATILCLNLLIIFPPVKAQRKLSRNEIHDIIVSDIHFRNKVNDSLITSLVYDDVLNRRVKRMLDSLKSAQIDTLGVFISSFPGALSIDTCDRGKYVASVYFFWKLKGKVYIQKVVAHCTYKIREASSSSFLEYYARNRLTISKENIMPVVYDATLDQDSKFRYTTSFVGHEPSYVIYCRIGSEHKLTRVSENEINDRQSIFYADNINSSIYQWLKTIKKEIQDIQGSFTLN